MSRTDKTDPYRVKSRLYGRLTKDGDYQLFGLPWQKAWLNPPAMREYTKQERRKKRAQQRKFLYRVLHDNSCWDEMVFDREYRDGWWTLS